MSYASHAAEKTEDLLIVQPGETPREISGYALYVLAAKILMTEAGPLREEALLHLAGLARSLTEEVVDQKNDWTPRSAIGGQGRGRPIPAWPRTPSAARRSRPAG